jgi:Na+-transporting NADH:ubiquinone oxidoreductase subunit A
MAVHINKQGLDLPISGRPEQVVDVGEPPREVAVVAADYVGMRPTMQVAEGDLVRRGQPLFTDKKMAGVVFTAPAAGRVKGIHRGERRAFQSIVVELGEGERRADPDAGEQVDFASFHGAAPESLDRDQVRDLLLESGLWTALRARPFGRVADPSATPDAIFVTAVDSNPLAPSVEVTLAGHEADFQRGLRILTHLTEGPVYVCVGKGSGIEVGGGERIRREEFAGPHPSGTVGLHIHRLAPVGRRRLAWHLGAQDVVAVGKLFADGRLWCDRVVALGGPMVARPRLLRTRLGASLDQMVAGELAEGEVRVISGSPLSGRRAQGDVLGFLGRYHQQVSVVAEDREQRLLGWAMPGADRFSVSRAFLSRLFPGKRFAMTSSTNGSPRAIVPIGLYERVMPFDIEPTFLLKSLVVGDTVRAEELGCLELEEEDLALLSFVCPGKQEYGVDLRDVLTTIEKEG